MERIALFVVQLTNNASETIGNQSGVSGAAADLEFPLTIIEKSSPNVGVRPCFSARLLSAL